RSGVSSSRRAHRLAATGGSLWCERTRLLISVNALRSRIPAEATERQLPTRDRARDASRASDVARPASAATRLGYGGGPSGAGERSGAGGRVTRAPGGCRFAAVRVG